MGLSLGPTLAAWCPRTLTLGCKWGSASPAHGPSGQQSVATTQQVQAGCCPSAGWTLSTGDPPVPGRLHQTLQPAPVLKGLEGWEIRLRGKGKGTRVISPSSRASKEMMSPSTSPWGAWAGPPPAFPRTRGGDPRDEGCLGRPGTVLGQKQPRVSLLAGLPMCPLGCGAALSRGTLARPRPV